MTAHTDPITREEQTQLIQRLNALVEQQKVEIQRLKAEYKALDGPLMGHGITNLELLFTLLREHRQMLDANSKGKAYPIVDSGAAYDILGWIEEMAEQLRIARLQHAFPNGVPEGD